MSERDHDGGSGSAWPIVIGVGAGLLVLVLVLGGVGLFLVTTAVSVALPPAQVDEVVITTEVAHEDAPTGGGSAQRPARNCTVRLTGTGDGGTWYMIDQDIYEGDGALKSAVAELVAEAGKDGERLVVALEVVPDAGITPVAVTAAGKVCAAAGAELAAPPAGDTAMEAGE